MITSAAISKFRKHKLHRCAGGQLFVTLNGRRFAAWPQCRELVPRDVAAQFDRDLAEILDWDLGQAVVVVLEDAR